jgi:hypothetical protein
MAHLADIRTQAQAARNDLIAAGPDPAVDVLGAIAWRAAWPEPGHGDPELADLIDRARAARFTWREIAVACGDEDTRGGQNRAVARQAYRRTQHPAT